MGSHKWPAAAHHFDLFVTNNGGLRITPWVALPFATVEPRLDGIDHHRGERNFLIEGVLADALMKIDRAMNRLRV